MRPVLAFVLACLASCAPEIPTGPETPYTPGRLPGYPRLGAALPAGHTRYDNGSLADLVVTLAHDLEWGTTRPNLIRYEGPVRVAVTGEGGRPYLPFLDRFLAQLRRETGIDVGRSTDRPNLVIRFVRGQDFRAKVPQHFCVVAPDLVNWERFRQSPIRYGTRAFETQRKMRGMTILIPDNAAPHVVRTCLIEELVQGPGTGQRPLRAGPVDLQRRRRSYLADQARLSRSESPLFPRDKIGHEPERNPRRRPCGAGAAEPRRDRCAAVMAATGLADRGLD